MCRSSTKSADFNQGGGRNNLFCNEGLSRVLQILGPRAPAPLNDIFAPKIAICQPLDLDLGDACYFTKKKLTNFGPFCKKCVFALQFSWHFGWPPNDFMVNYWYTRTRKVARYKIELTESGPVLIGFKDIWENFTKWQIVNLKSAVVTFTFTVKQYNCQAHHACFWYSLQNWYHLVSDCLLSSPVIELDWVGF